MISRFPTAQVRPVTLRALPGAAAVSSPFARAAEAVCRRLAELLCAPVAVVDRYGVAVAASDADLIGRNLDRGALAWLGSRIPLRIAGQDGAVLLGEPDGGEPIAPRLAHSLVDLAVGELRARDQTPDQAELKDWLIHNLLHGIVDDEATILRQARILGLDFGPPRAVILIDASSYILDGADASSAEGDGGTARMHARSVIDTVVSFFQLPNDTICAYVGEGEVAVLKASNTRNLLPWAERRSVEATDRAWANLGALRRASEELLTFLQQKIDSSISIGVGRYYPGMSGMARSYQDARAALWLGRHFHGHSRVHCLDSLGVVAFVGLSDERTKVELASSLLSPLDHEPELIKTLDHFFLRDCCPSSTAADLSIHRNTLSYRLDKIAALIGLDPRRFDEAVQIRLALILCSLRRSSL